MATYQCTCGKAATWYAREARKVEPPPRSGDAWEPVPSPLGWSYAACDEHIGSVLNERAPGRVILFDVS